MHGTHNRFFTPEDREALLSRLVSELKQDSRILGAVLVGSGAVGFKDRLSDIDLAVVVADGETTKDVLNSWQKKIDMLHPVIGHFVSDRGDQVWLGGFLFDHFLELDISFQKLAQMTARRQDWRVLFDRTGRLKGILETSWKNRSEPDWVERYLFYRNESWYYLLHAVNSFERGHHLRALRYLNIVRDLCILVAGLVAGVDTGDFREVHLLPDEFQRAIQTTLPAALGREEFQNALTAAANIFYQQARLLDKRLGEAYSSLLAEKMQALLSSWMHREYPPEAL